MNSKSAIARIKSILGLQVEKFFEAKTEQGLAIKMEDEMELGKLVYVATEEGLIPAPPGRHKLDDGTILEVDDSGSLIKIDVGEKEESIEEDEEEMKKKDMMATMFADVKLKDGTIIRMESDEPMSGARVRKVGYNDTLSALSDGLYETADGLVLSIVGCSIQGVQSSTANAERGTGSSLNNQLEVESIKESTAMVFTIAETAEGAKVESPTFDVGEDIYVIGEDGEKSPAPDGEHQVVLKDESGNENKIRVISKDGKIIERENVEQMEDTMMQIAELFNASLKSMERKLDAISEKQNELESKFQKFSKEPAGSRVYTQKTINETDKQLFSKYDGFRKLREELGSKI